MWNSMYNSYKVIMIPAKHILFYIQPIGTSCWCWLFRNMSKDIRLKKNSLCGTNWGPDRPLTLRLFGFYTSFTCSQTQTRGHFLRWFLTWLQQPIQPLHRWSFRLLHPDVWFCVSLQIFRLWLALTGCCQVCLQVSFGLLEVMKLVILVTREH